MCYPYTEKDIEAIFQAVVLITYALIYSLNTLPAYLDLCKKKKKILKMFNYKNFTLRRSGKSFDSLKQNPK